MRVEWIDRYKGLLILLVVMGHVAGGGFHLTHGTSHQFLHYLYLVIYSFHMPAFFFLAGVTWRDREDETFVQFVVKKARRLLVPYFFFGLVSTVIFCLLSGAFGSAVEQSATTSYYHGKYTSSLLTCLWGLVHGGGGADGEGFRMNSVLWFLPCLFSVEICYWFIRRLRMTGVRAIPVALVCIALAIFLPKYAPGLPWGLTKTPGYLVFLILGVEVFSTQPSAFFVQPTWKSVGTILALVSVYVAVCCWLPDPYLVVRNQFWWPVFTGLAVGGCVIFAWAAQVLRGKWWGVCGALSMGIMLLHKFPVVFLEMKIPYVRRILDMGVGGALFGTCALVGIVTVLCWGGTVLVRRIHPGLLGER